VTVKIKLTIYFSTICYNISLLCVINVCAFVCILKLFSISFVTFQDVLQVVVCCSKYLIGAIANLIIVIIIVTITIIIALVIVIIIIAVVIVKF